MLLAMWVGVAHAIECVDAINLTEIRAAMDRSEVAWRDLDDVGFRDGVNELSGLLLPCVSVVLPAEDVARIHRITALHLQVVGETDAAVLSIQAGHSAQAGLPWNDLVPADHELRLAWDGAAPIDRLVKVPEPRSGSIAFDGVVSRARPRDVPTLAQVLDGSGVALSTTYLAPGQPLPAYVAVPRTRNALIACSGGAVGLSALTYGLAFGAAGKMNTLADEAPVADPIYGARNRANALSVVSGLSLAIGAGCGAGAFVVGSR